MNLEVARLFLVALFIGALIGIEREQRRSAEPERSFGGVRTHILLALVGGASAWMSRELQATWIFAVALASVGAVAVASYVRHGSEPGDAPGITSEIAAIAVFLLGGMVVVGDAALAVALAVAVSAVLAFKQPLHGLVARIGTQDLLAGIKLLSATFIVLPLLPREPVDPWGAINLYQLWLLVVITSGLSMVGYVAMRWLGVARGTAVTGLAGGLVSSTATTLSFARDSRMAGASASGLAESSGILLAWTVMFVRVAVLLAIVHPALLQVAGTPLAVMGATTAAFALAFYRGGQPSGASDDSGGRPMRNPFRLGEALKFGLLFAGILLAVKLAQRHLPDTGLYLVAALAGLADVDAITLSIAGSAATAPALAPLAVAVCVATVSNTLVKCAVVMLFGATPVRRNVGAAAIAALTVGLLSLAAVAN